MHSNFASSFLLPAVLALIMFGMGLSLTKRDFKNILKYPKALITGLTGQMIILPAFAFLIAWLSGLPPELQVGIIIIAACPGGATSNLITHLLRGRVALSISLTTINSILVIITLPLLVNLGLTIFLDKTTELEMPILKTIIKVFTITIIPTALGILTRAKQQNFAIRLEHPLRFIMPVMLGIVFLVAILGEKSSAGKGFKEIWLEVIPWAFGLNLLGMLTGFISGKITSLGKFNQITLAVEVGIQNSALAITVASSTMFLNNYYMSVPAVVYGLFTFFNAVVFGLLVRKFAKR